MIVLTGSGKETILHNRSCFPITQKKGCGSRGSFSKEEVEAEDENSQSNEESIAESENIDMHHKETQIVNNLPGNTKQQQQQNSKQIVDDKKFSKKSDTVPIYEDYFPDQDTILDEKIKSIVNEHFSKLVNPSDNLAQNTNSNSSSDSSILTSSDDDNDIHDELKDIKKQKKVMMAKKKIQPKLAKKTTKKNHTTHIITGGSAGVGNIGSLNKNKKKNCERQQQQNY